MENTMKGYGALVLSEEAKKLIQERNDIGDDAGLYTTVVLWESPITKTLDCRGGYFVEIVEAEIYAKFLDETYQKLGCPYIVFIDGNLHSGGWKEENTKKETHTMVEPDWRLKG